MRKGILNSMRCAPPAAAPKTSDESPPWHANGMRKGILNSMRCAPPAAAPKTSDESPPWHAQSWHATCHGIHVRILPGYA